jgi:hypothetical protein
MVSIKNRSRMSREISFLGRGVNPTLSRPGGEKRGVINADQVML